MIRAHHLSQQERDAITKSLDKRQKDFIDAHLKRGRKTIFANVLAKGKAGSVAEAEVEKVASEWELVDYMDAGPDWNKNPQLFCECGRALRYQYIVLNTETSELKKFGITHFEEHVGISPQLVKEIIKGIETIDYERDEILIKIADHWSLVDEQIEVIPKEVEVPKDIQLHFDYDVPLLDRQIGRLRTIIGQFIREQEKLRLEKERQEIAMQQKRKKREVAKRRTDMLESDYIEGSLELAPSLQAGILIYLEDLTRKEFLASEICHYLVGYHDAPADRFTSGNFKIFPPVCIFLERLVARKILVFAGRKGGIDREYQME